MAVGDRTVKRRLHVIMFYLVIVIIYLLAGGAVMMHFEADNEKNNNKVLTDYVDQIKLTRDQRLELEHLGICNFPGEHNLKWSYTGGVFYTLTVITTIGYGSFAPRTLGGRIFTVFYAMFGISVIGLLLTNLANVIGALMQSIIRRISPPRVEVPRHISDALRRVNNVSIAELKNIIITVTEMDPQDWDDDFDGRIFRDIVNMYKDSRGSFDREAIAKSIARWYEIKQIIPTTMRWRSLFFFFLACCVWVWVWAAIFAQLEDWAYWDSIWFAVITLSTIGFGDFAPETRAGRIAAFVFISPGIGMVAAFISALTTMFERHRFWWMQKAYEKGWVSEKIMVAQGITYALDGRDPGEYSSIGGSDVSGHELVELSIRVKDIEDDEVPAAPKEDDIESIQTCRDTSTRSRTDQNTQLPRNREPPQWPDPSEEPLHTPLELSHHPYTPFTDGEPYAITPKIPSTLLTQISSSNSFSHPSDTPQQPLKLKQPRPLFPTGPRPKRGEYPTEDLMEKLFARPSSRQLTIHGSPPKK